MHLPWSLCIHERFFYSWVKLLLLGLFLHPSSEHSALDGPYIWNHSVPVISLILGMLFAYLLVVGPRRKDWVENESFPSKNFAYWILGLVFLYLAIASPIDHIGEKYLFWVHMVQHIILFFVSPIFFLLAIFTNSFLSINYFCWTNVFNWHFK